MSIFTTALLLLVVLNVGVLLGFWLSTTLRNDDSRNDWVSSRPPREDLLETSS